MITGTNGRLSPEEMMLRIVSSGFTVTESWSRDNLSLIHRLMAVNGGHYGMRFDICERIDIPFIDEAFDRQAALQCVKETCMNLLVKRMEDEGYLK